MQRTPQIVLSVFYGVAILGSVISAAVACYVSDVQICLCITGWFFGSSTDGVTMIHHSFIHRSIQWIASACTLLGIRQIILRMISALQ